MRRFVLPLASLGFAAVVALPALAFAQDGTPEPGGDSRIVPAAECLIEPRSAEEVFGLTGMTEGVEPPPPAGVDLPIPLGEALAGPDTEGIAATAREWLACINAGDNLRIAALLTDAGIGDYFGRGPVDADRVEDARSRLSGDPAPRTVENELIRLLAITDVSRLDDGRIAAFVVINEPILLPRGPETLLLIFTEDGDRWRIDEFVDFSIVVEPAGTPEAVEATPEPGA